MASIDRTAYPRFKRGISERELRAAYSPSLDEMEWARGLTDTDDHLLSLVVWLKCCQRLGYFPKLTEIPVPVAGHVRDELGLHEDTQIAKVATGQQVARVLDTSFAPEAWQTVIRDRRRPGRLVRRHLEICVFFCLADELVRGDVAAVGSEAYANWRSQLLSWEQCEPLVAGYCAEVGLAATASEFRRELASALGALATSVDQGYPDNSDLSIDEDGRLTLAAVKGTQRSASERELQAAIRSDSGATGAVVAGHFDPGHQMVALVSAFRAVVGLGPETG